MPVAGSGNACTDDTQCTGAGEACTFAVGATTGTCSASGHLVRDSIRYVAGVAANRQRIRIQFPNVGDGQSSTIRMRVASAIGGASLDGPAFVMARVAAVNAALRTTVAETGLRNAFVTSLYRKFGDYDQAFTEDGSRAYDLDWSQLSMLVQSGGIRFRGSDLRVGSGRIVFSTHFEADEPGCDPDVYADGWFRLVPSGDAIQLEWTTGPRVEVAASGADENGRIPICDLCRVVDVRIGGGKVEIWTLPPLERVCLSVSTELRTDATADPARGLPLPPGFWAPLAAGGTYDTRQTMNGRAPGACGTSFTVDMDGLFDWWGSDVPVPNPIYCNAYGVCAMLEGRQAAWARLHGLTRDTTRLPDARFPAGALLGRRTPGLFDSTVRARVSNGCVIPPDGTSGYRISPGVNDVAMPPSGDPPTRGRLDATVLLASDARQSAALFGSRTRCEGNPVRSMVSVLRRSALAR